MGQEVVVRVADGESNPSVVGRGVLQGCLISHILFSVYVEIMMKEAMEDVDEGLTVGGELLKDVRFAGLHKLMESLGNKCKDRTMT